MTPTLSYQYLTILPAPTVRSIRRPASYNRFAPITVLYHASRYTTVSPQYRMLFDHRREAGASSHSMRVFARSSTPQIINKNFTLLRIYGTSKKTNHLWFKSAAFRLNYNASEVLSFARRYRALPVRGKFLAPFVDILITLAGINLQVAAKGLAACKADTSPGKLSTVKKHRRRRYRAPPIKSYSLRCRVELAVLLN